MNNLGSDIWLIPKPSAPTLCSSEGVSAPASAHFPLPLCCSWLLETWEQHLDQYAHVQTWRRFEVMDEGFVHFHKSSICFYQARFLLCLLGVFVPLCQHCISCSADHTPAAGLSQFNTDLLVSSAASAHVRAGVCFSFLFRAAPETSCSVWWVMSVLPLWFSHNKPQHLCKVLRWISPGSLTAEMNNNLSNIPILLLKCCQLLPSPPLLAQ